ncbi:VOC family protein [Vibrio nomapromontoriensis]|uniref:VOC family protein n=1 Tax=Vibrio nomapromontoriensis TaxID=2910246 RepID=UPI003D0D3714
MRQTLMQKGLMPSQMLNEIDGFMDKILDLCKQLSLDLSRHQADHIAMRINDADVAKAAHQEWLQYGRVISEATINGRPIIVMQFEQPIVTKVGEIECLELPYPAQNKSHPVEHWEHIEFVVPSQAITAEDFLQDLIAQFPGFADKIANLKTSGISMKLSSPHGEGERLANPTVAFKYDGVCIKLHPHSLRNIVASEQSI